MTSGNCGHLTMLHVCRAHIVILTSMDCKTILVWHSITFMVGKNVHEGRGQVRKTCHRDWSVSHRVNYRFSLKNLVVDIKDLSDGLKLVPSKVS